MTFSIYSREWSMVSDFELFERHNGGFSLLAERFSSSGWYDGRELLAPFHCRL
jgi:hypothetical protein